MRAGAIVLLVTLAYLAEAQRVLGAQATLVVDQMLVLDTDPGRARETAGRALRFLAGVPGTRPASPGWGSTPPTPTGWPTS